jgi:hypothetical protein
MKLEIEGASISLGEEKRIKDAIDVLAKDPHAPREISVKLTLHVYNEYPKHVLVGKDKDDRPVTKIVASKQEETKLLKELADAKQDSAPAA